ncbi:tRNA (adenosine(37)-N6)-dimethylallyltransferase MiaA [Phreatobacter cathodiphilus]|uniref:tRNA dimethylallyltransferase n=1 Tax=Phreatobacter cathodiphilus TaxID=1868589 RepID=A0A2S0NH78_9HYPH|nr:tRNA (adenosine(37)-N6)-dimethylallyltransferase MiaA [Phreatobacter cathodiphilus]
MGDEGRDVGQGEGSREGHRPRAVLIAGPTASGKSALALDLAQRYGGVVVNADSMQVYRDLRIITARPTKDEAALAPHRLYGTVDAAETFSAGRWVEAASAEIAAATAAGALPIVVGGTGLYFRALTSGLSAIPPVAPDVRERVRREAEGRSPAELHAALAAKDPDTAARLRPSDPQRIIRAIEVLEATGRPLLHWQQNGREAAALAGFDLATVFLAVEREPLRQRIDRRFEAMMAAGALDEVAALAARGLDPALPAMRAHGVPGLVAHLAGEVSLAEAVARGQRDTRAYAKRQETWFRNQMPEARWLTPVRAAEALSRWLDASGAAPFPAGSSA